MLFWQAPVSEEQAINRTIVYERKRQKRVVNRGKRPPSTSSNEDAPVEGVNEGDVSREQQPKKKRRKVADTEVLLNPCELHFKSLNQKVFYVPKADAMFFSCLPYNGCLCANPHKKWIIIMF